MAQFKVQTHLVESGYLQEILQELRTIAEIDDETLTVVDSADEQKAKHANRYTIVDLPGIPEVTGDPIVYGPVVFHRGKVHPKARELKVTLRVTQESILEIGDSY